MGRRSGRSPRQVRAGCPDATVHPSSARATCSHSPGSRRSDVPAGTPHDRVEPSRTGGRHQPSRWRSSARSGVVGHAVQPTPRRGGVERLRGGGIRGVEPRGKVGMSDLSAPPPSSCRHGDADYRTRGCCPTTGAGSPTGVTRCASSPPRWRTANRAVTPPPATAMESAAVAAEALGVAAGSLRPRGVLGRPLAGASTTTPSSSACKAWKAGTSHGHPRGESGRRARALPRRLQEIADCTG